MTNHAKTQRLAYLSVLSALIVVLGVLSNFVRFGPVNITLALFPIIIGGALFGAGAGAILGFVDGLVVFLSGVFGWDGGFVMTLFGINPIGLIITCFGKTIAAGWLASLVYNAIAKKNTLVGVISAGIVCPVVNTGLFIVGMLVFFMSLLSEWAGGTNVVSYAIFTFVTVNFVIETAVNMVLASAITYIIKYADKRSVKTAK